MIDSGTILLVFFQITSETDPDAFTRLLSDDERHRAGQLRNATARVSWIVSHAICRLLISSVTKEAPDRIEIGRTSKGKPFLIGHPHLRFNLSHSGSLGIVGFCLDRDIGVDIEQIAIAGERLYNTTGVWMSDEEREIYKKLPEYERADFCCRCWVYKEALLKAIGEGFLIDPAGVSIGEKIHWQENSEAPMIIGLKGKQWALRYFSIFDGYAAACCTEHAPSKTIRRVKIMQFQTDRIAIDTE